MTDEERYQRAQRLAQATRAGKLNEAYQVLHRVSADDAEIIALRAGFSVIRKKHKDEFFRDIQHQIARAARHQVDGFGLRACLRDESPHSLPGGTEVDSNSVPGPT